MCGKQTAAMSKMSAQAASENSRWRGIVPAARWLGVLVALLERPEWMVE